MIDPLDERALPLHDLLFQRQDPGRKIRHHGRSIDYTNIIYLYQYIFQGDRARIFPARNLRARRRGSPRLTRSEQDETLASDLSRVVRRTKREARCQCGSRRRSSSYGGPGRVPPRELFARWIMRLPGWRENQLQPKPIRGRGWGWRMENTTEPLTAESWQIQRSRGLKGTPPLPVVPIPWPRKVAKPRGEQQVWAPAELAEYCCAP
jgi:hypothetical protein